MSIESAKAFLERIKNDEELRNKLKAVESKEERTKVAKAEGLDCTEDEWKEVSAELSEQELDHILGGSYWCKAIAFDCLSD